MDAVTFGPTATSLGDVVASPQYISIPPSRNFAIQLPSSTVNSTITHTHSSLVPITADGSTGYGIAFKVPTHVAIRSFTIPNLPVVHDAIDVWLYRVRTTDGVTAVLKKFSLPANESSVELNPGLYLAPYWSENHDGIVPEQDSPSLPNDLSAQPVLYALGFIPPSGTQLLKGSIDDLQPNPLVAVRGSMIASDLSSLPETIKVSGSTRDCVLYFGFTFEAIYGTPGISVWSLLISAWGTTQEVVSDDDGRTMLVDFLERWNVGELMMQGLCVMPCGGGGDNTGWTFTGIGNLIDALSKARATRSDGSAAQSEGILFTLIMPNDQLLDDTTIAKYNTNGLLSGSDIYDGTTGALPPPENDVEKAGLYLYLRQDAIGCVHANYYSLFGSAPLLSLVVLARACVYLRDRPGGSLPTNVRYVTFDADTLLQNPDTSPSKPKPWATRCGFATYVAWLVDTFADASYGDFDLTILKEMGVRCKVTMSNADGYLPTINSLGDPHPWQNADYIGGSVLDPPAADPSAAQFWPGGGISEAYFLDGSGFFVPPSTGSAEAAHNNVMHRSIAWAARSSDCSIPPTWDLLTRTFALTNSLDALCPPATPVTTNPDLPWTYFGTSDYDDGYAEIPYEHIVMVSAQCAGGFGSTIKLVNDDYTLGWKPGGANCSDTNCSACLSSGSGPPEPPVPGAIQGVCPWTTSWVTGAPLTALDLQNLLGNVHLYNANAHRSGFENLSIVPGVYGLNGMFILDLALSGDVAGLPMTYMARGNVRSCVEAVFDGTNWSVADTCLESCPVSDGQIPPTLASPAT